MSTTTTFKATIRLLSDAELGTGLGNEAIDDLVPRNAKGHAHIPASHLRGLIRDRLQFFASLRGWSSDLEACVLGEAGSQESDGNGIPSPLQMNDATAVGDSKDPMVVTITRTAVNEAGTVVPNTLRTVEAIAAESEFGFEVRIAAASGTVADLATRLALLSIEAIGGGRTRGAGACRISIDGETRAPGKLLRALDKIMADPKRAPSRPRSEPALAEGKTITDNGVAWFRLIFEAEAPVCCPEIPINGSTNHIQSGPVIPSSAVQGALITKIDRFDSALATACLESKAFRAWPLVPVEPAGRAWADDDENPLRFGLRVDLSHRMSKLPKDDDTYEFQDPALEPYHWREVSVDSPLRSSDGILRWHPKEEVDLWRASEVPRMITSHGVHHDASGRGRRNLYSVEALAPLTFVGLVALPKDVAPLLQDALERDPVAMFGRARRIGGRGRLVMEPIDPEVVFPKSRPSSAAGQVFVVQSPIAIPDGDPVGRAEVALKKMVEDAGWGTVVVDRRRDDSWKDERTAAICGVRFGWNRHGVGKKADPRHRRLRAWRVFLPGSVVVLKDRLKDIPGRLLTGLGEGRKQGYGALLPHPGLAQSLYRPDEPETVLRSSDDAGQLALDLFDKSGREHGPSPSQIGALAQRLARGKKEALDLLRRQRERGAVTHWHRWRPVFTDLMAKIEADPEKTRRALRTWQDLVIIHRPAREER